MSDNEESSDGDNKGPRFDADVSVSGSPVLWTQKYDKPDKLKMNEECQDPSDPIFASKNTDKTRESSSTNQSNNNRDYE
jgi:hypothetical protein